MDETAPGGEPRTDWSSTEVEAAVDSYLKMLIAELEGRTYSKAESRRSLLTRIAPSRTEAAVEFKHSNISAVMLELGLPYISGYKPRGNYQETLGLEIRRRLDEGTIEQLSEQPAVRTLPGATLVRDDEASSQVPRRARKGRIIDYGVLQEENRRLGAFGEGLVVEYERRRLNNHGRPDLAAMVRWIAREEGDGVGYDVLSFQPSGEERHLEVKTTKHGPETPFYITSAELSFALDNAASYSIYRIHGAASQPRFFVIEGDLTEMLDLEPVSFRARLSPKK